MNEKLHRNCENHIAENCDINTHDNLEPVTDDCGHYVPEGPGTQNVGDLNIYEEKNGRKVIVADGPEHNLDQDVNDGPGAKTE